ncbi:MAG: hypothetical protein QW351_09310, partial [Candidatus Caldarchaeum sp.]
VGISSRMENKNYDEDDINRALNSLVGISAACFASQWLGEAFLFAAFAAEIVNRVRYIKTTGGGLFAERRLMCDGWARKCSLKAYKPCAIEILCPS